MAEIAARPASIGGARGPAFPGGGLTSPSGIAPRPPAAVEPPPARFETAPVEQPEAAQEPPASEEEPLDLTLDLSEEPAAPAVGLPRFGQAGDPPDGPAPSRPAAGNSTLFERMANLSRGTRPAEEDVADEEGKALNIPRFLGRQNNQ
jgi:cell division protein FtsZ